jgi:hypothetical protein
MTNSTLPPRSARWITLFLALIAGASSLSLGGCTCADATTGDQIECPIGFGT